MSRRSYGTGALFERNGTWYGRWHDGHGGRAQRKVGPVRTTGSRDGLTKAQAEKKLREMMEAAESVAPVAG